MGEKRREHLLTLTFNKRLFTQVVIDPHYKEKHPEMTDALILELVKAQDGKQQEPVSIRDGFSYFRIVDEWQGRHYRLILTYCEEDFLGVINAFRVKEFPNV